MMRRPSNSGMATWVAASSGVSPSLLPAHWAREVVRHRPCRIGTSSPASAPMSHSSSAPPAPAAAGSSPPAASTVTTIASAARSASIIAGSAVRSDEQNTGSARPPAVSIASASACTKPVFPATWWAR